MVEELKSQTSKGKDIQQLLKELAQLDNKQLKPGAAKDLEDALAKGDLQKAREMLDKLANNLKAYESGVTYAGLERRARPVEPPIHEPTAPLFV